MIQEPSCVPIMIALLSPANPALTLRADSFSLCSLCESVFHEDARCSASGGMNLVYRVLRGYNRIASLRRIHHQPAESRKRKANPICGAIVQFDSAEGDD
jgi:hypothetical protein